MPRTRPSTRRCDRRSPPSWPATAWPQERISTWRMRPWSLRTIWRRWGIPCSSAADPPRIRNVSASSKRRSREMAGRTSASWRPREPPSIVRPPTIKRLRARWRSMARPIGPLSCIPRPRTHGDCSGWLGKYTPLLRGSRRSCGWRKRTSRSVKRMPRLPPRGSVPVRPPITTWWCEWKNDRSTPEAVRVSTRLVPSKPCGMGSSARSTNATRPWCANGQRRAVSCG